MLIPFENLKAIIFDFDGVVVDSEPLYEEAEHELIAELGLILPADFFLQQKGIGEDAFYTFLIQDYGANQALPVLRARGRELLMEKFRDRLDYVSGFHDFLSFAGGHYQTAVVTSTRRELMDWIFENTRVENGFAAIGTIDDVSQGKPEPEPYLNMCDRLEIAPAEALVIEDSLLGLRSARRAGCYTVGLTTSYPAVRLREIAHWVINQFAELQDSLEQKECNHEMVQTV